ncbi:phospholipase D family protein [Sediminicoccus sp. KRV36]|uniref:phospholipase D family protein n=1 Tax=Sediminicoccus sp. KRV36 TaxID=3133721 RepID=UPI00200CF534|nr:phospholipase D family protein [Sediminicoccus rosea]UPY38640.1 phospholipase D family protein [Sediminicoccus rosea]
MSTPNQTLLQRSIADAVPHAAGRVSGVALMRDAGDAFAVRAASARAAGRSLDLQYYMWRGDVTGQLLAQEVLEAADRGVTVRLLLDDVYALGRERTLAALDAHPLIEVRLFNGTRWRRFGRLGFLLELAFGGRHLNRRMHNKSWIADDCLAVVGGRNLGDAYFGLGARGAVQFRDLDLLIAGPAAQQATHVFNRYWASPLARPARLAAATAERQGGLPALRMVLACAEDRPAADALLARLGEPVLDELAQGSGLRLLPHHAIQVVADPPAKAKRGLRARKRARAAGGIAAEIADALRQARQEALLISPYFVPGQAGLKLLCDLCARGVRVSVVTNSLAATDVVAVHGGYAKYRQALLAAGVTLFELKPRWPDGETKGKTSLLGSRGAALHTKAFAVDGALGFVGSFNLDPRSAALNTEMGTFVCDAVIAGEVAAEHARLADPAVSWQVVWEDGRIGWRDGGVATLRQEPMAGAWRRVLAGLVRRLPVEEQL